MRSSTVFNEMYFCPKCRRKYDAGSERFCPADGARLHPEEQAGRPSEQTGVFSSILSKKGIGGNFEIQEVPPRISGKKSVEIEESGDKTSADAESPTNRKTAVKQIKPEQIPSPQAELGDRRTNPVGRLAFSANNPNILLGQTIKGRYFIKSRLSQTAHGIKYLGTDNLNDDRKVIVRIFTGRPDGSDFSASMFAAGRVALSHIDHPNIAKMIDSGELPEGNPFVVIRYVNGISLKENFSRNARFDFLRTARLIRQAANGLSEAHRNGVLHRSLSPDKLILSPTETGTEQFIITDFNIFSDKARGDFTYLAPEQIAEEEDISFAADIYSLATIGFQMLTGEMPFKAHTSKELYKAQQKGFQPASGQITAEAEKVLRKALAFDPAERFQSIRDFGDAFYRALTSEDEDWSEQIPTVQTGLAPEPLVSLDSVLEEEFAETENAAAPKDKKISEEKSAAPSSLEDEEILDLEGEKSIPAIKMGAAETSSANTLGGASADKKQELWKRRSPDAEAAESGKNAFLKFAVPGALLLLLTAFALYYFFNRPAEQPAAQDQVPAPVAENAPGPGAQNASNGGPVRTNAPAREMENLVYFESASDGLSEELAKHFRKFSLYYPKGWTKNAFDKNRNRVDDKFIDISKNGPGQIPVEQFMVSYYESRGSFELDRERFPEIVARASEDIKNSPLPNFRLMGAGETLLKGRPVYEMKFQGEGTALNGDKIKLWGRRFYIPAEGGKAASGLVVTLLATSLSKNVKSPDELGEKGDLKTILESFEPDRGL